MRRRLIRDDSGLTLIELIITVAIMAIITVPLANFIMQYFSTYADTQTRLSDSHDTQIAAAYFSQDVANTGLRDAAFNPTQSVWTPSSGFPATYCGKGIGTTVVLMSWDDWTVAGGTGANAPDSVAYIATNGTLVRVSCNGGTAVTTRTTLLHNLVYPDSGNTTPITCPTTASACSAATAPSTIKWQLSIKGPKDTSVSRVTLVGQRRQSTT